MASRAAFRSVMGSSQFTVNGRECKARESKNSRFWLSDTKYQEPGLRSATRRGLTWLKPGAHVGGEDYWYSASMRRAPEASKAVSKDLDFLIRMSANCFSWWRETAWSLTISRRARKATIMAWREGQASKNSTRLMVEVSLARIRARSWAIIWATVKDSCWNSRRVTSFLRSRTCWKTRTRSTRETTSSPSVASSL